MGDLNYWDICWKNNTAAHMPFTKFLERIEDLLPHKNLTCANQESSTAGLATNQKDLLCNISVSNSLGCSEHNILESEILQSMLKFNTSF